MDDFIQIGTNLTNLRNGEFTSLDGNRGIFQQDRNKPKLRTSPI